MKNMLVALVLCTSVAHAQNSASEAMQTFMQETLQGDTQKAAALVYLAPELLAHAERHTVLADLAQCLKALPKSGIALKNIVEQSNDGKRAVLEVTLLNDGTDHSPPPVAVLKSADGWRVDMLSPLLEAGCENIDIGSPLPAAQAVIEAIAAEDAETLAELAHIKYYQINVPPDDPALRPKIIAQMREEIASLKADNLRISLKADAPLVKGLDNTCIGVPVLVREGSDTYDSTLPMCKSARGWQVDELFSAD